MRVDEVKAWVARIEALAYDALGAHLMEDEMLDAVLQSIADGRCEDPEKCAVEALKSRTIEFDRYGGDHSSEGEI